MEHIQEIELIINSDPANFVIDVKARVSTYEGRGYRVEVQYSTMERHYTALVIGFKLNSVGY
jgi:hypothetical protein